MKTVKGVRHESGGGAGSQRQQEKDSLCSVARNHTVAEICFRCLLSTSLCLFFDSRFTVLVSSLALIPQTLNNITTRSVKPLRWSNTSEEVICAISSPHFYFCLVCWCRLTLKWLGFCSAKPEDFLQKWKDLGSPEQGLLRKLLQLSTFFSLCLFLCIKHLLPPTWTSGFLVCTKYNLSRSS